MSDIKVVNYNKGKSDNKVAFVLSCPGQFEEQTGRLVARATGDNLEMLIERLHDSKPDVFRYTDRYDYRLTNSSNIVHYDALDGRSEPLDSEIKKPDNIKRLVSELSDMDYIITCGKKAQLAIETCKDAGSALSGKTIINIVHMGNRGVNSMRLQGAKYEGRKVSKDERIEYLAEKIVGEIG